MSYDFALMRICSHEIRKETGVYDKVNNFARIRTPPSSQKMSVWIDGELVPPSGLWSHASLTFMNPGPYRIRRGQNDLIYVRIGNGIPTFVQLITGNVKTSDMVKDLSRKIPTLNFSENRDKITIKSKFPTNGAAFSFVDPRWTDRTESLPTTARVLAAYERLGVIPGRVATGRMIFPPWTVEKNTLSSDSMEKVVQFHAPLPNQYPVVHVSYTTYANYCRRCRGAKIEFDYGVIGGSYERVDNADLLSQELDKFTFTRIGSHWRWPWIGSKLIDRIGGKGSTGQTSVNSMLTMDVSQAFMVYQNIKMQQDQDLTQKVSDAEYPLALKSVDVLVSPNDPTVAVVSMVVTCRSRVPIELKRVIGNPNPYTVGSNLGIATTPDFFLRG